jgi:ribosomal protein S18 acetylase RimI-like enzyme
MSRIRIELLRPEHCSGFTQLLEDNDREEITGPFHPFPMTRESSERLCLVHSKDLYYVAFVDDVMVGLAMLRGWDEGYEVPSFGAFIDYRYQGRGLGRLLTDYAISEARQAGCANVRLSVYESNVRGRRLYSSLGFHEQSRDPVDLHGHPDKRIVMVRGLSRN